MSDESEQGEDSEEIPAPGWDAIDAWVGRHCGGQTPHQFTSLTPYELDTPSPLPAVTVWATRAPAGWLYVTYGLSELFGKSSDDPQLSGFGFELSLRIPPAPARPGEAEGDNGEAEEAKPPVWPLRLLQSLGHHVLATRSGFDSGHAIELGASMVPKGSDGPQDCILTGMICVPDPLLGKIETVNGSLLFLRLFGVTADELAILDELELGELVACVAELEPLAITDATRASFNEDPERSKILRRYRLKIEL